MFFSRYSFAFILMLKFGTDAFPRKFFATTVTGLESVLEHELSGTCGAKNTMIGKNGVHFEGDDTTALKAVMYCRTSLRIMENLLQSDSKISSKDDLYSLVSSIDWQNYLLPDSTLKCDAIIGRAVAADLSHTHFSSLTVKNAIVDQFRDKTGFRPSVDLDDPYLPLLLYLHRGQATLYRVWSGELSMHKRGYRDVIHKAALRETTAAALLLMVAFELKIEYAT